MNDPQNYWFVAGVYFIPDGPVSRDPHPTNVFRLREATPGPIQGQWIPEASGFLYGSFLSKIDENHSNYELFLVTNRHVIEDHASTTNNPLSVKFNLKPVGSAREYDIPLKDQQGKPTWHFHPNPQIDIAIIQLNGPFLQSEGARFSFFESDRDLLSRVKAAELGLSEGDGIFVLGFPMGIVDKRQDYVIVRQGVLARIRNTLDSPSIPTNYLADSFVFPGTSGSPVLLKPEFVSIQGGKPGITKSYLLGIVKGFIPYIDVAVSAQTKRARVTFEENSGLAEVIPADYIDETIQDLNKTKPQ